MQSAYSHTADGNLQLRYLLSEKEKKTFHSCRNQRSSLKRCLGMNQKQTLEIHDSF